MLRTIEPTMEPLDSFIQLGRPRRIVKELRKKSARQEGYKSVTENKWVAQVVELFRFNKEVKKYEGYQ